MTDEETNTLAVRGQEELFFQLWFCVSFWFWREIGFGFTYLCTQSTVQLRCCINFLVLAGNSFWCYVRTQCTIQLCSCVSFLVVAGNRSQNENTFLQKILLGYFIMTHQQMCVFHKTQHSFTLYLSVLIFLLYRADSQVEFQIRILHKDINHDSFSKISRTSTALQK